MPNIPRTWIVAAEAGRARIFVQHTPGAELEEVDDLLNPAARTPERRLTSDDRGRTFDSRGAGRHAKEPRTSAKKQEETEFARELCQRIERARTAEDFDRLVLVAAPEFLGLLRKHLSPDAMHRVSRQVHKNLVREDADTIRSELKP